MVSALSSARTTTETVVLAEPPEVMLDRNFIKEPAAVEVKIMAAESTRATTEQISFPATLRRTGSCTKACSPLRSTSTRMNTTVSAVVSTPASSTRTSRITLHTSIHSRASSPSQSAGPRLPPREP